jgi:hypothetical protein
MGLRRVEFREAITHWLASREWSPNECYPFEDISELTKDMEYTLREWGIEWVGCETFGETVTFGGNWISEGLAVEININPTKDKEGFRVLYRWK